MLWKNISDEGVDNTLTLREVIFYMGIACFADPYIDIALAIVVVDPYYLLNGLY